MHRINILLTCAALAAPLGAVAQSDSATLVQQSSAPSWVNVAVVGNTAAMVAPQYSATAQTAESKIDAYANDVAYWEFPEPEFAPPSIWPRIREGFAFPQVESRRVAQFEGWYKKHPEYFERMIARSGLFLHYIVEEVEKRGMPTELALLPMIESAYNPTAYSRAHASGIWQFIPSTGERYGLEQNWWHDERRDVVAATRAALDYLEMLHGEFNDWHLALAAYNYGENGVHRAIKRNKTRIEQVDGRGVIQL